VLACFLLAICVVRYESRFPNGFRAMGANHALSRLHVGAPPQRFQPGVSPPIVPLFSRILRPDAAAMVEWTQNRTSFPSAFGTPLPMTLVLSSALISPACLRHWPAFLRPNSFPELWRLAVNRAAPLKQIFKISRKMALWDTWRHSQIQQTFCFFLSRRIVSCPFRVAKLKGSPRASLRCLICFAT
jgi:hypothetical protein